MDRLEYKIGRFTLTPFRELLDGGVPVPIGRKPLELLSVLAKAEGALVTKDELMSAVWPKSIVEDNAIQVHIAALRKALGGDADLLITVHGLGYRLTAAPVAAFPQVASGLGREGPTAVSRRWARPAFWSALALVAVAAPGFWFLRDRLAGTHPHEEGRVFVLPFDTIGPAKELHVLAGDLLDEIVHQLSGSQVLAVSPNESRSLRGADPQVIDRLGVDMMLDGTVQRDGNTVEIRVHLDDVREHVILWSGEFRGSIDAPKAIEAQVGAQVADVVYSAKIGRSQKAWLDAASLAALIDGRVNTIGVRGPSFDAAVADYRKVIAATPDFSWGHSGVAAMEMFKLRADPGSTDADVLRADAALEAKRPLALDPQNGEAWMARVYLAPLLDWRAREALLIQGIDADPDFEPIVLLEGRLLWHVGRGRDALPWLRRAHAVDPLRAGDSRSLALGLAAEGGLEESRAIIAQMEVQWPDHYLTKDARFWHHLLAGRFDEARAQLSDPVSLPNRMNQKTADAWRVALRAMTANDTAAVAQAAQKVRDAAIGGSLSHGEALTLLAMLGDLDDAFAQAELYRPADPSLPPYLFLPMTAAMRSDPRFMRLAEKLGLVDYWRGGGHWPDFCSEPGLPYDCRDTAAKLAALHPTLKPAIGP